MSQEHYSIQVQHLTKKFGTTQALAGLSLELAAGKMHGIIGPEGAGKTTLLRIILGLLHPDQGEVKYYKGDRLHPFGKARAQFAYMPGQQNLYADLSIGEHLDFFKNLYQLPNDFYVSRREQLLKMTRLAPFVDRPAGKLSGGMYKKLGLMCSLLHAPQVLLMDEPTNGVDPISRREFWELLHGLLSTGILIIVTTAYMDEAERCAIVHLIEAGSLIASGEPRTLMHGWGVGSIDELFLKTAQARDL
jgi:ABC-2 type transport system ATP-binding protein